MSSSSQQRVRHQVGITGTAFRMIPPLTVVFLVWLASCNAFPLQPVALVNRPESRLGLPMDRLRDPPLRQILAKNGSRIVRDGGGLKASVDDVRVTADVGNDMAAVPDPASDEEEELPYDWRKHWYAVGFDKDIVKGPKPFGVSIFDEPLVLYRDNSGAVQCVSDFCPHRASKLSEGQVTKEGNIECLYHGWQFDGSNGACVKIPQLAADASIPRAACVRVYPVAVSEGVVFVWMGNDPWGEGAKDILPVPSTGQNLDKSKPDHNYEFVYDLPYDWSYLAENLVDPAHVCISHDASSGGGKKENAGPIDFEVIREGPDAPSPKGFASLATMKFFGRQKGRNTSRYTFEAPGILRQRSVDVKEGGPSFGAALHCIPLGKGRSRLLFKVFITNLPALPKLIISLKPTVLRHLNSCKILEQDVKLICAQEDHVARTGQPLSQAFLPIKTSDALVVELRKWLDRVGHGMPHFTGWNKSKDPAHLSDHENPQLYDHRSNVSRYHRHVLISAATRRALAMVKGVKKGGLALAVVFATSSILLAGPRAGMGVAVSRVRAACVAAACAAVCSLSVGVVALIFEGHFYTNFERHPSLK